MIVKTSPDLVSAKIKCDTCSNDSRYVITDHSPQMYVCEECLTRSINYGEACARLNRMKREMSIPGHRITQDELRAAERKVESCLLRMLPR